MSKWISGDEIIKKLKLRDFEFFSDYVSKGLQPYDERGRALASYDILLSVEDMVKKEDDRMKFEVPFVYKQDWKNIQLPESYLASKIIIDHIKHALYRIDDLKKFGKNVSDSNENQAIQKKHSAVPGKTTERKLRPDQRCKFLCRKISQQFWDEDPTLTIADMIKKREICDVSRKPSGALYQEETVRNWIKDLCPNRKGGRRPKKAVK